MVRDNSRTSIINILGEAVEQVEVIEEEISKFQPKRHIKGQIIVAEVEDMSVDVDVDKKVSVVVVVDEVKREVFLGSTDKQ